MDRTTQTPTPEAAMTMTSQEMLIAGLEQNAAAAERDRVWRADLLARGKVVPSAKRAFQDQVAVDEFIITQARDLIAMLKQQRGGK
jgi:hypothetical protein